MVMSTTGSHPFGYSQGTNNSLGLVTPNLQQAARTLGGQQQQPQFPAARTGGSNGQGGHVQGHVTPTSMPNFSPCLPNSLPPQQPSPNSRSMLMGSRPLPNQRSLTQEMKRIVGIGGPLGGSISNSDDSFGKRDGSSMFNVGVGSLTSRSGFSSSRGFPLQGLISNSMQSSFSSSPGDSHHANFGLGMVKQPTNESNEFQIHSEDFPALPGSQTQDNNQDSVNKTLSGRCLETSKDSNLFTNDKSNSAQKRGIQTSSDGRITHIPAGMVTDQFGMVGLLSFIRASEADPKLVSLALGSDLTTLGLNLNTSETLYPSFAGPWAEHPCRPQDIDYHVPTEYLVNQNIRDKLAPVKLNRYGEDLLFYLFYMFAGDMLQIAAAAELYNRDWRFHKDERVWITRVPGMNPTEKSHTYERGMYYFFDADNWRKVAKEFHLDYDRLEERPQAPSLMAPGGPTAPASAVVT